MSTDLMPRGPSNAVAEANTQAAIAEVQAAMMVAQSRPRNEQQCIDRIVTMCTRKRLAETAMYCYARGGQDVTGPSIRLAEAIALGWRNITTGWRVLETRADSSVIETFAWDLEANVKDVKVFTVSHVRHTRNGAKKLDDPRDIYELQANQAARRKRSNILAIIPGDVVERAIEQCDETLKTTIEVTPHRIQSLIGKFAELGVTKDMIETRIQRRADAINTALMINLGKVYTSLKDGMSSVSDWFDTTPKSAADNLNGTKPKTLPPADPKPAPEAQPAPDDIDQGEAPVEESQEQPLSEADKLGIQINEATSKVQFVALSDAVEDAHRAGAISETERKALHNLIKTRRGK